MRHFKILLFLSLIISSCNAYRDLNVSSLKNGMSKSVVADILNKKLMQVSLSTDSDGKIKEVFEVQKRIVRGGIARQQRFNLYFIDNKLVKYEKESEKFSF